MTALIERGWATISDDGQYRYGLGRTWGPGPVLGWIGLNPSKADAEINDMTVLKIIWFSRREGYGGAWIGNLYALRATSPLAVRRDPAAAVGPENDQALRDLLAPGPARASAVVLAWGAHGGEQWARPRAEQVLAFVYAESAVRALCLGTTAGGQPRHPCRLAHDTPLQPWQFA